MTLQHLARRVTEHELDRRKGLLRALGPEERDAVEELAYRLSERVTDELLEQSRDDAMLRAALARLV